MITEMFVELHFACPGLLHDLEYSPAWGHFGQILPGNLPTGAAVSSADIMEWMRICDAATSRACQVPITAWTSEVAAVCALTVFRCFQVAVTWITHVLYL